jgi:membrane associated rhomboid family serine protease
MSRQVSRLGFSPQKVSKGAAWLVGVLAALFVVWLFGGPSVQAVYVQYLTASADGVFGRGQLWTLVTAPVIYPSSSSVIQMLLDGLVVWMMTPTVERWWGTKRWVVFLAATSIIGTFGAVLAGWLLDAPFVPVFGLGPYIWGSVVAFGVLFARQPISLFGVVPIQGRSLAIGAAALLLLMTLFNRNWVAGAGSAVGMLVALIMTSGFTPNLWMLKLRRLWVRRKLNVMSGGAPPTTPGKKPDKRWMN